MNPRPLIARALHSIYRAARRWSDRLDDEVRERHYHRNKIWRKKNPEKTQKLSRLYFERNRDKIKEKDRAYRERNREMLAQKAKERYRSRRAAAKQESV